MACNEEEELKDLGVVVTAVVGIVLVKSSVGRETLLRRLRVSSVAAAVAAAVAVVLDDDTGNLKGDKDKSSENGSLKVLPTLVLGAEAAASLASAMRSRELLLRRFTIGGNGPLVSLLEDVLVLVDVGVFVVLLLLLLLL
jgi:hypothetical protein